MASATGRKPSGRHERETHLHTGIDHRHKHHQGQQQETRQVETQHEQGARGGRERKGEKEIHPGRKPTPTMFQEPAQHSGPRSQGRPTAPSFPVFPKKSSCSEGPCRTVLQYSPHLLLPLSGHHLGGPATHRDPVEAIREHWVNSLTLSYSQQCCRKHGRSNLKNHLLITGPRMGLINGRSISSPDNSSLRQCDVCT
jgi:hypothetical protein